MEEIVVSVVCTNYNKGDWIAEAIESFLAQEVDFKYEIIVIDDHSTDHSTAIIREYVQKYPGMIRGFYNEKNLGITKTWIKACKQAKGEYIARCDGDDFWIDTNKLQKQVKVLRDNPKSLWCSTDFDMILPDGTRTHQSAFETGAMVRADSYENMLATKGFTMASTWLVAADLVRNINESIDAKAVDDTFNLQIELFYRTELIYIPKAMAAYRVGHESDSHPVDIKKAKARNDRLLQTQLEYIGKYQKNVNFNELAKQSVTAIRNLEAMLLDKNLEVAQQRAALEKAEAHIILQQSDLEKTHAHLLEIQNSKRYKLASIMVYPKYIMRSIRRKLQ